MRSGTLGRISSLMFMPLRRLLGPLHRRHQALGDDEEEKQEALPRLPPPWSDDPRWYRTDFLPRSNNIITPLPHGAEYFPNLYEEILAAQERVTIAGWALSPVMALCRDQREMDSIYVDVVRKASESVDVCILLWSGAPALFEPNASSVKKVRERLLEAAPKVRCELDTTASFSHDHHQKAVTIDGRIAYVGGMDISTFQGDRWDTSHHPLRFGVGWHDVQVRLEGGVVTDVEENFCQRWNEVTGDRLIPLPPPNDPGGHSDAQVVRTIPKGFYHSFAPDGLFGIRHALLQAIGCARRSIYIENQYLWAPEIVDALCEAMDRNDPREFRIVVVLPARAYTGRYDNDQHVRALNDRDAGRGMFAAYSLYASGPGEGTSGYRYLPIYVHAKVTIVDDEWFMIGSANLNRRGLATDSEIAVQCTDARVAEALRHSLWAEHLGLTMDEVGKGNFAELADGRWKQRSREAERCRRDTAPSPAAQVHPYEYGGTPASRMMDRIQSMTLEH